MLRPRMDPARTRYVYGPPETSSDIEWGVLLDGYVQDRDFDVRINRLPNFDRFGRYVVELRFELLGDLASAGTHISFFGRMFFYVDYLP